MGIIRPVSMIVNLILRGGLHFQIFSNHDPPLQKRGLLTRRYSYSLVRLDILFRYRSGIDSFNNP